MRRGSAWAVVLFVLALSGAAPRAVASTEAASGARAVAKPVVKLRVLPDNRAAVLRRDRLRVLVGVRSHPVRLRFTARPRRGRSGLIRPRVIRVGAGRRRVVRVALNDRARRRLSTCARQSLVVHARRLVLRRQAGRLVLRRHRLRLRRGRSYFARDCPPNGGDPQGDRPGGGGGPQGDRPGSGGGGLQDGRPGSGGGPRGDVPGAGPGASSFAVGAAKASTSPTGGLKLCLGGYGSCPNGGGRTMTGIKDELYARALAVSGGDSAMILVTTTNIGLFAAYKTAGLGIYHLRQEVARRTGLPADHVIVQADHSHSGPDTIGIWGGVPVEYLRYLQDGAIQAAVDAYKAREPARVYVGRADGAGITSSYSGPPNVGTDDEFRLLWANRRSDGSRIATFSNYSPHATVLKSSNKLASGDWPEWAAQMAEAQFGGTGLGGVGTLGREDFGAENGEPEAKARLARMIGDATAAGVEVPPERGVDVRTTFIQEPLAQPILLAINAPEGTVDGGGYDLSIDRSNLPPWVTGEFVGTYAGAARIGDVFFGFSPGEPFPQVQFYLREDRGIEGARMHFHLGGANDFLGYMVRPASDYPQVAAEGGGYLVGCPEEELLIQTGMPYDPACPDHWTLMVSPTIGTHVACTIQNAGQTLGFSVGARDSECPGATASDGAGAPSERPAGAAAPQ